MGYPRQQLGNPELLLTLWLGNRSYPLTVFLRSVGQNRSFSLILFGRHARCDRVFTMGGLHSSSRIPPHHDCVNFMMYHEAIMEGVWRCTWRPWLYAIGSRNRVCEEIHLVTSIQQIW